MILAPQPLVQNLSEFHEAPYLGLPYRNPTEMALRYRMDTIFVYSTSNNPPYKVSSGRPADVGLPDFIYARFARMTSLGTHLSRIIVIQIFVTFPLNALPNSPPSTLGAGAALSQRRAHLPPIRAPAQLYHSDGSVFPKLSAGAALSQRRTRLPQL
ncbi:hypothetical protein Y032_0473g2109 [Ancylostoma ceylanicum]|nr:hypothetical protein Y032_0473g2109 [Ancylostoma ceylanicum]